MALSELLDAELPEIDLDLSGLDLTALDFTAESDGVSSSVAPSETPTEAIVAPEPEVTATEPVADEEGELLAYADAEVAQENANWPEEPGMAVIAAEETTAETASEEELWEPASSAWTEEATAGADQSQDFQYDYRAAALLHANMIESSLDGLPDDGGADAFEGCGRKGAAIEITSATEDDVEDIIELAASLAPCSMSPFRPVSEERVEADRRADMQSVYKLIHNDDFGAFVARDAKGNYIGHILVKSGLNDFLTGEVQAWVFDIAVQPKYWGSGISKRLLLAAERFVRERGIKFMGLTVTAANARALRFYQRAGYQEERYQMVKILPPLETE